MRALWCYCRIVSVFIQRGARMMHTRRDFLRGAGLAAVSSWLGGCERIRKGRVASGGAERSNIIFILADDLGYGDLGSYGQRTIRTPNLDRMAAEGMIFTDHYAGSTVCAPSRCCVMDQHPDVVKRIATIMASARTPSEHWP